MSYSLGIWMAPTFSLADIPTTCGVKTCTVGSEPSPSEAPKVTAAQKLQAHFILSVVAMRRAALDLESELEDKYSSWGLDTNDADETFKTLYQDLSCDDAKCTIDVEVEFDVDAEITPEDGKKVCDSIIKFFKAARSGINGNWICDASLKKRAVTYLAPVTYTESLYQGDSLLIFS